jgi:hypothetical protein
MRGPALEPWFAVPHRWEPLQGARTRCTGLGAAARHRGVLQAHGKLACHVRTARGLDKGVTDQCTGTDGSAHHRRMGARGPSGAERSAGIGGTERRGGALG